MNSRLQRKLSYLRDRAVNAYWMLRQGRFRQVVENLILELRTRQRQLGSVFAVDQKPVQHSAGGNPCKPRQPSPRPTVTVAAPALIPPPGGLDEVAATLESLLGAAPSCHGDEGGARQ